MAICGEPIESLRPLPDQPDPQASTIVVESPLRTRAFLKDPGMPGYKLGYHLTVIIGIEGFIVIAFSESNIMLSQNYKTPGIAIIDYTTVVLE